MIEQTREAVMEEKIVVAVIVGTSRPERESIKAAKFVAERVQQHAGAEMVFVDPRELRLPDDGDDAPARDARYTDITARADAFYIVSPEYNHGYPGSLKRLLDSEYENYKHKPVAVAGVSSGNWGGVRMAEAIQPVLHRLGLVNIHAECYFPFIQDLFDDQGAIKPEQAERFTKSVDAQLDQLLWFAKWLKAGRVELKG